MKLTHQDAFLVLYMVYHFKTNISFHAISIIDKKFCSILSKIVYFLLHFHTIIHIMKINKPP